ncbi:MAG TPA: DUF4476 domain-containing protein, partial [Bacteroidales bacterium]|nr:DUF4476 domain-containing protein [Bacteroidales bacterium]
NDCIVNSTVFDEIKAAIRKESFSTTRVEIAKSLIQKYECFTTMQIKDLLPLFSLETDKLEIAKYSYAYCKDKENYDTVKNFFTSGESRDQISNYIKNYTE